MHSFSFQILEANVNALDEDGDTCLHLALNDKLTNSDSANNKHINTSVDLKDCKLLSMVLFIIYKEKKTISFSIENWIFWTIIQILNSREESEFKPENHIWVGSFIESEFTGPKSWRLYYQYLVKIKIYRIITNLKIAQNMPSEYSNNIRLIISSYLIQNGAKLTKNKHQISPLDYLTDPKMSDLLQKQCLAFE